MFAFVQLCCLTIGWVGAREAVTYLKIRGPSSKSITETTPGFLSRRDTSGKVLSATHEANRVRVVHGLPRVEIESRRECV